METSDYELLYLYRVWQSDIALEMIYEKYSVIIKKKLNNYRIREYHYDDFYQELLMVLQKAIMIYDQRYKKSFYRFSEMLFDRKIANLLRHDTRNDKLIEVLMEENTIDDFCYDDVLKNFINNKRIEKLNDVGLSELQRKLLVDIFIKNETAVSFAKRNNMDLKTVYNAIYLLRKKVKKAWEITL